MLLCIKFCALTAYTGRVNICSSGVHLKLFCTLFRHYYNVCIFSFDLGNFQCIHQSCPTRSLQLMEDGPSVMLPCDSNTSINSSSTTAGNYTYCHDATILVTHSTSYYTLGSINYALDNSQICCFDNQVQSCAVCYNLGVYCKCSLSMYISYII